MTIELWIVNILIKLIGYKAYETQADLSSISEEEFEKLIPGLELLIDKALITELDVRFCLMISDLIKMDKGRYTAQVRELTYYDLFTIADDLHVGEIGQLYSDIGKSMIPPIAMLLQNKLGSLNEPVDYYDKYWEKTHHHC